MGTVGGRREARVAAWASASASASAQPTAMSHTADGWHFRLARLGVASQITEKLRAVVAKLALLDYSRIKSSLSRTGGCQGEGCVAPYRLWAGELLAAWLPGCLAQARAATAARCCLLARSPDRARSRLLDRCWLYRFTPSQQNVSA